MFINFYLVQSQLCNEMLLSGIGSLFLRLVSLHGWLSPGSLNPGIDTFRWESLLRMCALFVVCILSLWSTCSLIPVLVCNAFFKLQSWLGFQFRTFLLHALATKRWRIEKIRRKILFTSLCSLSYHAWKARNDAVWKFCVSSVDSIMYRVQSEVKQRVISLQPKVLSQYSWIKDILDHV